MMMLVPVLCTENAFDFDVWFTSCNLSIFEFIFDHRFSVTSNSIFIFFCKQFILICPSYWNGARGHGLDRQQSDECLNSISEVVRFASSRFGVRSFAV